MLKTYYKLHGREVFAHEHCARDEGIFKIPEAIRWAHDMTVPCHFCKDYSLFRAGLIQAKEDQPMRNHSTMAKTTYTTEEMKTTERDCYWCHGSGKKQEYLCPKCGSQDMVLKYSGISAGPSGTYSYNQYRCKKCAFGFEVQKRGETTN